MKWTFTVTVKCIYSRINFVQCIGAPYGSVFEIGPNNKLIFVPAQEYNEETIDMEVLIFNHA